jgi:hypothetical protein
VRGGEGGSESQMFRQCGSSSSRELEEKEKERERERKREKERERERKRNERNEEWEGFFLSLSLSLYPSGHLLASGRENDVKTVLKKKKREKKIEFPFKIIKIFISNNMKKKINR